MRTNITFWSIILLFAHFAQAQTYTRTITIEFDTPPNNASVELAKLKYDKEFAYSLTLDDGEADAWHSAFKLINGDIVTNTFMAGNTNYGTGTNDQVAGGYNSTDGCGNSVKFDLGLSINAYKINNGDAHLTWNQLQQMHNQGWDIYNHSFNHQVDPENPNSGNPITADQAIEGNSIAIEQNIGFYPRHFVIPSNSDYYLCDFGLTDNCTTPNTNGMVAIYNQNYQWGNEAQLVNTPFDLDFLLTNRGTVPAQNNPTWNQIKEEIDGVANAANSNNKIWYNEYTHTTRKNGNGVPNLANLGYTYFKQLMDHIEGNYGQSGTDEIWVAGLQKVYEYLYVRDHASISTSISGNVLTISATFSNPQLDQQNFDLSILVNDNNANISNITIDGGEMTSNNNTGLINFSFLGASNENSLTISCPDDISVTTSTGSIPVSWTDATATTTCNVSSAINLFQLSGPNAGNDFYIGSYTIAYQANDQCNNQETCNFNILVTNQDESNVTINCPNNIDVTTTTGSTPVSWVPADATTTCEASDEVYVFQISGQATGSNFSIGSHTITYQANDQCNNQETCSFIIEVTSQNNGHISINCPDDIDVTTSTGSATVNWNAATANTTCPTSSNVSITQISGQAAGSNFSIGSHIITYQANDQCNNQETCSFIISVEEENTGNDCNNIIGFSKLGNFDNHGYYLSENNLNWAEAKAFAENNGGYLTSINNINENEFIRGHLAPLHEMVFIGYNDADSEGNSVWANGEPITLDLSYGNTDARDYAIMNFWAGTWEMNNSLISKKFILEKNCDNNPTGNLNIQCPTSIEVETENGFGIANWTNPMASTTCNISSDITLTQTNGLLAGSNFPVGIHTISYQATDLCENTVSCTFTITVQNMTVTACDTRPGFFKLGEYNGHGYYRSNEKMNWEEAVLHASNADGYLVAINTTEENEFLRNKLALNHDLVFIGFNDHTQEGTSEWSNQEPTTIDLSYGNTNDRDFAIMNFWAGTWEMHNGQVSKQYILEKTCGGDVSELTLNCPEDIYLEITTNHTLAYWDTPIASTSCPNNSITISSTSGHQSGSNFSVGAHTVSYEATDECGNTRTCSFNIYISNSTLGETCDPVDGFTKLGEFENHSYFLSDERMNWREADIYTKDLGGYLVSINTQNENEFLKTNIGSELVYIGYSDGEEEGVGTWANGDPVTLDLSFNNTPSRDFAIMNFWAGTWQMNNALVSKKYIMEVDCAQNSANYLFNQISFKGLNLQAVYPNPVNDILFARILANTDEAIQISVVDLQGTILLQKVKSLEIGHSFIEMDTSELPAGIYFFRATGKNSNQVLRFVKL